MNSRFNIIVTLVSFSFYAHVFSQKAAWQNKLYFESNMHYGFVMPHHTSIAYFVQEHIKGYQFNVGLLTSGEKEWHQYYNYPRIGVGFYHSGLGNNEVYGKINALFFYFDRYYFKHSRRFNLGNRLSFGLGCVNKRFDREKNYFDDAIGSKLNVYINYSVEGVISITPLLQMKLGLGFNHTSNGRFREPNKGLNLITSFAGIQYSINKPAKVIETSANLWKKKDTDVTNQFLLMGAWGQKQISVRDPNLYSVMAFSAEYAKKINRTNWIGLGLNCYYDPSLSSEAKIAYDTLPNNDYVRISVNLSYEVKMGRLSYIFQPGLYLKNPFVGSGVISNRIGLRYELDRHVVLGVFIKAHWVAIADFIEWGVGYRFVK